MLTGNGLEVDSEWREDEIPKAVWRTLDRMNAELPCQHAVAGIVRVLPEGDMVALQVTDGPVDCFVFPCGCVMDAEDM